MLRPFTGQDLDSCVALFVATFAQPPWEETWSPSVVRARLDQIVRTPEFFGVVSTADDGKITGFALGFSEPWHEGTHFYLKEMCVAHGLQRRGIGSGLMDFLIARLQERDTRRIYLLTARGNLSESFYAKAGFYTSPRMILMARRFDMPSDNPPLPAA